MDQIRDLGGRRAVVCGSTQGIGRASARLIAERGASVVLVARNASSLEAVLKSLSTSEGQTHHALAADFGDVEQLRTKMEAHVREFGPFEILVNNTGGPKGGPLAAATTAALLEAVTHHLLASHVLLQTLLPGMTEAGYGRVINITSTSVVAPIPGLGVSNTVRAAMSNWARTLAYELGPLGITVNGVLPGFTDTQRLRSLIQARADREGRTPEEVSATWKESTPLRRFASPDEIAQAVAFLASPAASYISGVNLPVDGGRTAAQ